MPRQANQGILACNVSSTDTSAELRDAVVAMMKARNAVAEVTEPDHVPT